MGTNGTTVKDIANECKLSVSTVNYILNGSTTYKFKEATKSKVFSAAAKLGYKKNVIASSFRLNNNKIIFGIVSYTCRQADLKLLIALKKALYKRGYKFAVQFLIDMSDEDRLDFFARIQGWGAGLVISTLEVEDKVKYGKRLRQLLKMSPPSISLFGKIPGSVMNYTDVDWCKSKEILAEYFKKKGCSNIALCIPPHQVSIGEKWMEQISKSGLKVSMLSAKNLKLFDYQALGQAIAYNLIKTHTMFDAIYSVYDEITFGIREVFLKSNIRIPEDIIVVSGGDCDFCNMFSPPIPIFMHDCDELAELAAEDLIKRIETGEKTPGNCRNAGVVYQKLIEFDDIYETRTFRNEIEITQGGLTI